MAQRVKIFDHGYTWVVLGSLHMSSYSVLGILLKDPIELRCLVASARSSWAPERKAIVRTKSPITDSTRLIPRWR